MFLPKFKIEAKLLISFLASAVLPLLLISVLWFQIATGQITQLTTQRVQDVANEGKNQLQSYFQKKIESAMVHTQTQAFYKQNNADITTELQTFLAQDADIQSILLLNSTGQELVHVDKTKVYAQSELTNDAKNTDFTAIMYTGTNRYIGPLYYKNGLPLINITLPIVKNAKVENLQTINISSTGSPRQSGEIQGVLIEKINVNDLWDTFNTLRIGSSGYVFVVDNKGNVLTNPSYLKNLNRSNLHKNPIIETILQSIRNNPTDVTLSKNEFGKKAFIGHSFSPLSNWIVVAEAPESETLGTIYQVLTFAIILFFITLIFIITEGIYISGRIVNPIKLLERESKIIGEGNFINRIHIDSNDEIEELGNAFNTMAERLQTAFKNLEETKDKLLSETNQLSLTLASITDGVIVLNQNHEIVIFNKAVESITGYSSLVAVGKKINEIVKVFEGSNEILPETYCPISTPYTGRDIIFQNKNLRLYGYNNMEKYVHMVTGKIRGGSTFNMGCFVTIHDVTKEYELEKMKNDFVSIAAHELRSPATVIKGYLSLLKRNYGDKLDEENRHYLDRSIESGMELASILENFLNSSRIESGVIAIKAAPLDWNEYIKEIVRNILPQTQEKHIELSYVEPQKPLPSVSADKLRINEVVNNLLTNAIKYTQDNGKVTITVEIKDNNLITHVSDNGRGIPKDAIPQLFTKYYRVHGENMTNTKGTGLGLYISKSIVEMHHGTIWVNSEIGKGTTFSFSLPLAKEVSINTPPSPEKNN